MFKVLLTLCFFSSFFVHSYYRCNKGDPVAKSYCQTMCNADDGKCVTKRVRVFIKGMHLHRNRHVCYSRGMADICGADKKERGNQTTYMRSGGIIDY